MGMRVDERRRVENFDTSARQDQAEARRRELRNLGRCPHGADLNAECSDCRQDFDVVRLRTFQRTSLVPRSNDEIETRWAAHSRASFATWLAVPNSLTQQGFEAAMVSGGQQLWREERQRLALTATQPLPPGVIAQNIYLDDGAGAYVRMTPQGIERGGAPGGRPLSAREADEQQRQLDAQTVEGMFRSTWNDGLLSRNWIEDGANIVKRLAEIAASDITFDFEGATEYLGQPRDVRAEAPVLTTGARRYFED